MTVRRLVAPYSPEVEADLTELGALVGRIESTVTQLEGTGGLYEQRNAILKRLLKQGVSQAELARRCNRSSMTIALAVGKGKPASVDAAGSTG